jgi:hypothetical protein
MLVSHRGGRMNPPLLLDALAATRIEELRRDADAWRRAAGARRPWATGRVTARSLNALGFWLVGAGLRLAVAGAARHPGR